MIELKATPNQILNGDFQRVGRSRKKSGSSAPGWYKGINVAPPPLTRSVLLTEIKHKLAEKVASEEYL
jgi:hypothetical protein